MRISDWSSDVCSSDLLWAEIDLDICRHLSSKYAIRLYELMCRLVRMDAPKVKYSIKELRYWLGASTMDTHKLANWSDFKRRALVESIDEINCIANFSVEMRPQAERWSETVGAVIFALKIGARRLEEHTSELQSLMRSSYSVFCL